MYIGKKTIRMLLISLSLLFLFAACSEDSSGEQTNDNALSEEDKNRAEEVFAEGKYDPPITVTTVRGVDPSVTFKWGETIEDNVHTEWAKERLGIELDYLWSTTTENNAFETRVRLALSANEEIADIVPVRDVNLANDLIDSGRFMRVDDLFEEYASDMYKDAVNEDPSMWNPFTREDGAYAMPIPDYSWNNDTLLFIRQDWMENLDLDPPETLEDVEEIMEAFVTQDPNGTGEDDTYGLAVGFSDSFNSNMANTSWIFGAHGTLPEQWNEAEDGSLEYGSVNPASKEALSKLNEWMEKGYIHQEAGLHDEMRAVELFTSGRAGIIAGPYWMDRFPLSDVYENDPDAKFLAHKVPVGPEGETIRKGTPNFGGAILINKEMENPEAFFLYQNYLFDHFAFPEEGSEFEYMFAEGYDYILDEDGNPTREDIPDGMVIPQKYTLTFEAARIPSSLMEAYGNLADGSEPSNSFEVRSGLIADEQRLQGASVNLESRDLSRIDKFNGAPTPSMVSSWDYLETNEKETFSRIIYGDSPIDEFDTFVENWHESGGEAVTTEVNEWYEQVNE